MRNIAGRSRRGQKPLRRTTPQVEVSSEAVGWTFLTNHSHVLICLARDPERSLREVSLEVGITERSVQRIVSELEAAGYLERIREGRKNRYTIRRGLALRHPIEAHRRVGDLIAMVLDT